MPSLHHSATQHLVNLKHFTSLINLESSWQLALGVQIKGTGTQKSPCSEPSGLTGVLVWSVSDVTCSVSLTTINKYNDEYSASMLPEVWSCICSIQMNTGSDNDMYTYNSKVPWSKGNNPVFYSEYKKTRVPTYSAPKDWMEFPTPYINFKYFIFRSMRSSKRP